MNTPLKKPGKKLSAQAMVEFALALPVLLLVIYGLLETGRVLFMYASVVTAARQAARYGSASGDNGSGVNYYNDCPGIRAAARRVAFIQNFSDADIQIAYDQGPGTPDIGSGCPIDPVAHPGHPTNGDRIKVSIRSQFNPILRLVPFTAFPITSADNRTLLVGVQIEVTPGGGGTGGNGALRISKTADPMTYSRAGQTITYHYSIQNDGTDPIDGPFTISDDKVGTVACPGAPNPLPGGSGSFACNNATYTITTTDIIAGSVTNNAYALNGDSTVLSNVVAVMVTFEAAPEITLAKSGVPPSRIVAGQSIQYTFKITNTGNAPVTPPYTISDPLIGSNWSCPSTPNPLAPGGTVTCTGNYVLQPSDIGKMSITNTATATAQYNSTTVRSEPASATVLIPQLYLVLTASPTSVSAVGASVTYTYSFTNRTNTAMGVISVTDSRGANIASCLTSLNSGATRSCTHVYTPVTQTDLDSPLGYFTNTAQGSTTGTTSNQAGVNVSVLQTPSLTLTKTASPILGSGQSWSAGQVITYTYTLRNSGNVTIAPSVASPLKITDSDPRVVMAQACMVTSGALAPGAALSPACTGILTLTDADIAAGSITSTGTANGMFGSTALTASSTYTLVTFYGPRLSLVKTANKAYFTGAGEIINYSYAIKNTGGQVLTISTSYSLTDNKTGSVSCPGANKNTQIQLGASISCTGKSYTTTPADVAAQKVQNTVSVQSGATSPATAAAPASLTISLLTCDASHPTTSPYSPIVSGLNTNWNILNNTGTDLHISGATITWTGGNLSQVLLTPAGGAGYSAWSGSTAPNGTISLPTAGWPSIPYNLSTPSVMTLRFDGLPGADIKVSLTFQESVGGTSCSITSP